jgi:predicted dehydrogenase
MKDPKKTGSGQSRREFIKNAAIASSFFIVPRNVLGGVGFTAPSDQLVLAAIGAGGKGASDIELASVGGRERVIALCDVDFAGSAKRSVDNFPKAKLFADYREMLDKMPEIDAVTISTPDHVHGPAAKYAMERNKHVYVQKPMTHNIREARMLTEMARSQKVVTQMGNQGGSNPLLKLVQQWIDEDKIGAISKVQVWTNRPVWPQGGAFPKAEPGAKPDALNWDLWLGPAPEIPFTPNLHPFNWRGWWDYGTGALGDMACHIMEPPFRVLGLGYPKSAECSVGSVYVGEFQRGYFPDSCPPSSHITLRFDRPGKEDLEFHWMDGGIQPTRPEELEPNEQMGDGGNGVIIEGTKGKMMCSTYGVNPQLLPTSKTKDINVPETLYRVPDGDRGHYRNWVEACIGGYGSKEYQQLSSPFSVAGPLTESVLMGNLAIRSYDYRVPRPGGNDNQFDYPGRGIKLVWDGPNMKITNFDPANQFVKREYRGDYTL